MSKFKVTTPTGQVYVVEGSNLAVAQQNFANGFGIDTAGRMEQGFTTPSQDSAAPQTSAAMAPAVQQAAANRSQNDGMVMSPDWRGRIAEAGQGLTMNSFDELMGAIQYGMNTVGLGPAGESASAGYDRMAGQVRSDVRGYERRRPVESTALGIGASIPTLAAGGMLVRGVGQAVPMISKAPAIVKGVAGGAGYGGAAGYMGGDAGDRGRSAVTGTVVGAGIGAIAEPVGKVIGNKVGRMLGSKSAPTAKHVEDAASTLYKVADDSGVQVEPTAISRVAKIRDEIGGAIADPTVDPKTYHELYPKALTSLAHLDGVAKRGHVTLRNVESDRRVLQDAVDSAAMDTPDERMAIIALKKFDAWREQLKPRDFINGKNLTGREAIQVYNQARLLWRAKAKGDTIASVIKKADAATMDKPGKAAFSQSLRNGFKRLYGNEAMMRGWSIDEKKAIEKAAGASTTAKILAAVDALTPAFSLSHLPATLTWGGLGAVGTASGSVPAAVAGGIAALGAVAGGGSRMIRNKITRKAANQIGPIIRSGGEKPFNKEASNKVGSYAAGLGMSPTPQLSRNEPLRLTITGNDRIPIRGPDGSIIGFQPVAP